MRTQSLTPSLSWWVGLTPRDFYREVAKRAPVMSETLEGRATAPTRGMIEFDGKTPYVRKSSVKVAS